MNPDRAQLEALAAELAREREEAPVEEPPVSRCLDGSAHPVGWTECERCSFP